MRGQGRGGERAHAEACRGSEGGILNFFVDLKKSPTSVPSMWSEMGVLSCHCPHSGSAVYLPETEERRRFTQISIQPN